MSTDSDLRLLPAGDRALLLAPGGHDDLAGIVDVLRGAELPGMADFLPAAETVLVTLDADADAGAVERALRGLLADPAPTASVADDRAEAVTHDRSADEVTIEVRYDGPDLEDVARLLGIGVDDVIAEHTGRVWRCRFIGFAAGFGYLESDRPGLSVPRRDSSRTAVPRGAVALADGYSAVYPRRSPGGWQLIGTTDAALWDLDRPHPALLSPGTRVRFVDGGAE
ncbi:MAG TPA: allophanate hydrolase subunit 1 [Aldersonia sp.]